MDQLQPIYNRLDTFLAQYKLLVHLETTYKIPKVAVFGITYLLFSISIFFKIGHFQAIKLLGLSLPIYKVVVEQSDVYAIYLACYEVWSFFEIFEFKMYSLLKAAALIWLVIFKGWERQVYPMVEKFVFMARKVKKD